MIKWMIFWLFVGVVASQVTPVQPPVQSPIQEQSTTPTTTIPPNICAQPQACFQSLLFEATKFLTQRTSLLCL